MFKKKYIFFTMLLGMAFSLFPTFFVSAMTNNTNINITMKIQFEQTEARKMLSLMNEWRTGPDQMLGHGIVIIQRKLIIKI